MKTAPSGTAPRVLGRLFAALGLSCLLLALWIRASFGGAAAPFFSQLWAMVRSISAATLLWYTAAVLARTALQAWRYRLILQPGASAPPGFGQVFLATASRNMFVDMLPARLGELSFAALLKHGLQSPVSACLLALALAFLFDLAALACIIAALALYELSGLQSQAWLWGAALAGGLAFAAGLALVFSGTRVCPSLARKLKEGPPWLSRPLGKKLAGKLADFFTGLGLALQGVRNAGMGARLFGCSLAVRGMKYLGLYSLFQAVAAAGFPEVERSFAAVLAALVCAEAAASLPLPAFMGFGVYETGGVLALAALGAGKDAALLIMLAVHLVSQAVDYVLGGSAFFLFMTRVAGRPGDSASGRRHRLWPLLAGLVLCVLALFVLLPEWRTFKLKRAMDPPVDFGRELAPADGEEQAVRALLQGQRGFLVWSSNRSGNHALWRLDLPGGVPRRLTNSAHAEYFPRISPDGAHLVFARSRALWCSQRDELGWDLWLLHLADGRERLLARGGNAPSWSQDGKSIFFQRKGRQFVRLDLASGQEELVLESGKNLAVPADTWLETPSLSPDGRELAVTFRGARRATALVRLKDGAIRLAGDGCELAWAPDGTYLYKVGHGGKQQNAFYRLNPEKLKPEKWLDLPGEFSHEYFPRLAGQGRFLVFGASQGGHEHDKADYEIFLWRLDTPQESAVRLTFHSGNDNWPDMYFFP